MRSCWQAFGLAMVLAGAVSTSCTCAGLPPGTSFLCERPEDCAPGEECVENVCVALPGDGGGDGGSDGGDGGDGGGTDGGAPDGGLADAGPPPVLELRRCVEGWCWESPYPQGNDLNDLDVVPGSGLWVVGDRGTVLRWDGGEWTLLPRPGPDRLIAIEPWDGGVVVAGDGGFAWHWRNDQGGWQPLPTRFEEPIEDLAPDGAGGLWAVTASGHVWRFSGSAWQQVYGGSLARPALLGVASSGPNAAWAVGVDGTVLHWNGATWADVSLGGGHSFSGVWMTSPEDVWISAESQPSLLHRDAGTWVDMSPALSTSAMRDVFLVPGDAQREVWMCGDQGVAWRRRQFGTWQSPSTYLGVGLHRVRADMASVPVLVGEGGAMARFRYTDHQWEPMSASPTGHTATINALWSPSPGVAFAGSSQGHLLWMEDGGWNVIKASGGAINGVWGADPGLVIAVGEDGQVSTWDGTSWSHEVIDVTSDLYAVHGSSRDNVWVAASRGTMFRRLPGAGWQPHGAGVLGSLLGVWVESAEHAVAVGASGAIVEYRPDAGGWIARSPGIPISYSSVWGDGQGTVWTVSSQTGAIWRSTDDGETWVELVGQGPQLYAVAGASPSDVWFAGEEHLVHYTGMLPLVPTSVPAARSFRALAVGPQHLRIGGDLASIIRYDRRDGGP
jgi:hypothetical protein